MNKNSNSCVFDTGVLSLYFGGDKKVRQLFQDMDEGTADGFTTESNLAEVYYKTCEQLGRDTALTRYRSLRHSSLIIVAPDENLTLRAAQLKCSHRDKLSLTDSYVISLTKRVRGHLLTTDPRIAQLKIVPTEILVF